MKFEEQLKKEFIPVIEEMLEKEVSHLQYMVDAKEKILKNNIFSLFPIGIENREIEDMIQRSKHNLNHLRLRLKEYIEYANE